MNHTKEPWRIWNHDGDYTIEVIGECGVEVDIANASFSKEDAERVVACVNACSEMPTEILTSYGFSVLETTVNRDMQEVEAKRVTDQRNELLLLMKEFCDRVEVGEVRSTKTYNKFKTAIEKIEAEK